MDQIQIGKFIAQIRKEQNLTQRQLADKLGISDKTVSKWECGKGLPEVSLMLPLCEELNINVNELLSGERLTSKNYCEKAEENIMNLVREKEESKKKIILSNVVGWLCVCVVTVLVMVAGLAEGLSTPWRIFLVAFSVFVISVGIAVACVLDRDAGTFECAKCKTRFVPDMKAYVFSTHGITVRRLKCPNCGETTYCKHRLTK